MRIRVLFVSVISFLFAPADAAEENAPKGPIIVLYKTVIDFGAIAINTVKKDSVKIFSAGSDTLSVSTALAGSDGFSITPVSRSLPPGTSFYLPVMFEPTAQTDYSAFIILTHNGATSSDTIVVKGAGKISEITSDIFPLTPDRRFIYSGYLTHSDTESPIAGTAMTYNSSWTVGSEIPLSTIFGPSIAAGIASKSNGRTKANIIFDTTSVVPSVKIFTPFMIYKDSSSDDLFYLVNLGLFFRSSVIKDSVNALGLRNDSLQFMRLASPKAGVGGQAVHFAGYFTSYAHPSTPMPLYLQFTGMWYPKVDVTVNGVTYQAFYLVVSRTASFNGTLLNVSVVARWWFVPGIGPVKMFLAGDNENPGHVRELKTFNFLSAYNNGPVSPAPPKNFRLLQNYPNPFNPTTTIGFTLQSSGLTTLKIYDALGREVASLADEHLEAGVYYQRVFEASGRSSGIYLARLSNGNRTQVRKLLLMK